MNIKKAVRNLWQTLKSRCSFCWHPELDIAKSAIKRLTVWGGNLETNHGKGCVHTQEFIFSSCGIEMWQFKKKMFAILFSHQLIEKLFATEHNKYDWLRQKKRARNSKVFCLDSQWYHVTPNRLDLLRFFFPTKMRS